MSSLNDVDLMKFGISNASVGVANSGSNCVLVDYSAAEAAAAALSSSPPAALFASFCAVSSSDAFYTKCEKEK